MHHRLRSAKLAVAFLERDSAISMLAWMALAAFSVDASIALRYLCSLPSFASETMLLSLGKHLSCLLFTLGYIQQYIMRGQLGIVGRRIQLQTFVVSKEYRVIEFSE